MLGPGRRGPPTACVRRSWRRPPRIQSAASACATCASV